MSWLNLSSWKFKVGRADLSALLLIAFLFQLLVPIAAFSDDASIEDSLQAALRHSICGTDAQQPAASDPSQQQSQTDGFTCDWCVRCSAGTASDLRPLSEAIFFNVAIKLPHAYTNIDDNLLSDVFPNFASAPRAPPFSKA